MSRLEKFIDNNREAFDDMEPSGKVWEQVEAAVVKKTGKRLLVTPVLKWCAAAAVLITITVVAVLMIRQKEPVETAIVNNADTLATDAGTVATEDAPEMRQFAQLIANKQQELKISTREQPLLYQKFSKDFTQLDSSYNTLKSKLNVMPNRELLIAAMIQNLELQLHVLNQQLSIIHQIKQSKNYNHEEIDPSI